jgi:hypothetical protein
MAQRVTADFEARGAASVMADEARPRQRGNGHDGALAAGLGWFSVGLGVAEVAAPGLLTRAIGVANTVDNRELLRAAGLREIASGLGLLTRERQTGWAWARVGGDVMDLALLGAGFRSSEAHPKRLAVAAAAVAGVTALDVLCGRRLSDHVGDHGFEYATRALTINRPVAEVEPTEGVPWLTLPKAIKDVQGILSVADRTNLTHLEEYLAYLVERLAHTRASIRGKSSPPFPPRTPGAA